MNTYRLGLRGLALIKRCETLRLKSYQDDGGVWTIGWGHTGKDVGPGISITEPQATAMLRADVGRAEAEVNRLLTHRELLESQVDALISFEFNTGGLEYIDKKSGKPVPSRLLQLINGGDVLGAWAQFASWRFDNGSQVLGLAWRRNLEMSLFLEDMRK